MKNLLAKIKVSHLVIVTLLFTSLCFPSTREAHVLCLRLLLHLRGDTVVQGQPPGCVVQTIPNVQFTEKYKAELCKRSKDSLDSFALASAAGDISRLEPPIPDSSWTNHVLLEWAVFRMTWWISTDNFDTNQPPTNSLSLAYLHSARRAIQLAQSEDPTNGALWLAEARLDFAEKKQPEALAALETAATNRQWNAGLYESTLYITKLLKKSGLSDLDAMSAANSISGWFMLIDVPSDCRRGLENLMAQALNEGDESRFLRLLKLWTDLRRADWTDDDPGIFNSFRDSRFDEDAINAMAKHLGERPLPAFKAASYNTYSELEDKIVADFFNQLTNQTVASVFLAQRDIYQTEKKLRNEIAYENLGDELKLWACCNLSGLLAVLFLSVFIILVGCKFIRWKFSDVLIENRRSLLKQRFWWLMLSLVIFGTLVMTNCLATLGLNNEVGVEMGPGPWLSPCAQDVLVSIIFVSSLTYLSLLLEYKPQTRIPSLWQISLFTLGAYLVSILLMASFRSHLVSQMIAELS